MCKFKAQTDTLRIQVNITLECMAQDLVADKLTLIVPLGSKPENTLTQIYMSAYGITFSQWAHSLRISSQ